MLDNEKPSVIFLHGSGANSQMWSGHIIALQDTFNCIAPDLPGHGSRRGDKWTSLEDVADSVADMDIEKCNFTSPTLFISGEKEAEIIHSTHKFLSKKINGSRYYTYPDGGHAWMVKDPQTHIKLVKDWLTLNHGN